MVAVWVVSLVESSEVSDIASIEWLLEDLLDGGEKVVKAADLFA